MNEKRLISISVTSGIGRLVIQRPEKANALSSEVAAILPQAIDDLLALNPRVIVLSGEGECYCAGGDIDEFVARSSDFGAMIHSVLDPIHPALFRLATSPIPIIAAVNGSIGGAGIGLALCADYVLATTKLKLRTGYAALGLSPDLGVSYFLARRIGTQRAKQWLMLSETISANQCLSAGAVDAIYPVEDLDAEVDRLAARLAQGSRRSLAAIKRLCDSLLPVDLMDHLNRETQHLVRCANGPDAQEGIRAFVERRKPAFQTSGINGN